jgi:hypothetical protein
MHKIVINFLCCQPTQLAPPVNSQAGSQVSGLLTLRSRCARERSFSCWKGLPALLWCPAALVGDCGRCDPPPGRLRDEPIIGWNRGATAPAAATLNSSFIQGFALDDFHPVAPIHGASIVLPSLLTCASQIGMVSGEHFLLGAVAGFEVGPRVGLALHGAEMLSRGWHSGPVFGTFAAASAVGVLLPLKASQFEGRIGHGRNTIVGTNGRPLRSDVQTDAARLCCTKWLACSVFGSCWLHGHQEDLRTTAWRLSLRIWRSTFTRSLSDFGGTRRALGDRADHHQDVRRDGRYPRAPRRIV